ncbi:PTS sugar transporter subunit IIA [Carnobacterium maltaromaticum]|uniref:PTS sugar transporter subunit IIA n=1 Tax=Carnobacterium maltaromaticum TaxID=2751 RepID=UPI00165A5EB9|nr:PTS sugar transporter subunit IIA [Carnobacterium maltaromaticum]MBC9787541.1 PTS mannitol transporter subunit IIA [Carnobacterium maltaromaticum]
MKITKNQVEFQQESVSKEQAIKEAGRVLLKNNLIEEQYIESMLEKEKSDITYIGNGIAIPHGMNEAKKYVKKSGISVIHYPNGIQYDENKAYLIIGIAGGDNDHLEILQDLAVKLSDEDYVDLLVKAPNMDKFLEIFNQ